MSTTQIRITELVHEADHCQNAYRLWQIAAELERLSAWMEARSVERMAERIEEQASREVT